VAGTRGEEPDIFGANKGVAMLTATDEKSVDDNEESVLVDRDDASDAAEGVRVGEDVVSCASD